MSFFILLIDWLNHVLRRFQHYFSLIMGPAHIIHVFPGFHQYLPWAPKSFAQGHSNETPEDPEWLLHMTMSDALSLAGPSFD